MKGVFLMYYYPVYNNGDRQMFWVPFLLGGLGGAAIASTARPRPVYVTSPNHYQTAPYGYNYYGGYNYNPYYH